MAKKKEWITEEQKEDVWDKLNDTRDWIDLVTRKQAETALHEDPVFKVHEIESRLKRVEVIYSRVNNIQKPKAKTDYSKFGKNIKMDNITFDGNSGDVNWDDFIKINPPPGQDGEDEDNIKGFKVEDFDPNEEL